MTATKKKKVPEQSLKQILARKGFVLLPRDQTQTQAAWFIIETMAKKLGVLENPTDTTQRHD